MCGFVGFYAWVLCKRNVLKQRGILFYANLTKKKRMERTGASWEDLTWLSEADS